jgi:putative transcriptional regulator
MKNQVRFLRKEKQWSQRELAQRVGVSPHCIDAIEHERFLPSIQLAYDIAAVFERSVVDVFPPPVRPSQTKSEPELVTGATHSAEARPSAEAEQPHPGEPEVGSKALGI